MLSNVNRYLLADNIFSSLKNNSFVSFVHQITQYVISYFDISNHNKSILFGFNIVIIFLTHLRFPLFFFYFQCFPFPDFSPISFPFVFPAQPTVFSPNRNSYGSINGYHVEGFKGSSFCCIDFNGFKRYLYGFFGMEF